MFSCRQRRRYFSKKNKAEKCLCLWSIPELRCTCWARKIWAETLWRWWPQTGKCRQTRKHKNMSTIQDCLWLCNYSTVRQQVYRLESFCQIMDIHMSGSLVDSHNWPKMGTKLLARPTISYFLSYQDCHHLPAAARLLHRDHRISQHIRENREQHHQIQWQIDVTSQLRDAACRKHETGWKRKIQRKKYLIGCRTSQLISRNWRNMCPHISMKDRTKIRKVLLKWLTNQNYGNTVLKLIFLRIEIATYTLRTKIKRSPRRRRHV